jgi:hypothetical protein
MMFGPVSSATPDGGGPIWNGLVTLIALGVLGRLWTRFLSHNHKGPKTTLLTVLGLTAVTITLIGFGIYGLLH